MKMRSIPIFLVGILFDLAIGQQVYDAYNYPNPLRGQFMECHVEMVASPARICDPDEVLTQNERQNLNEKLLELERNSARPENSNYCAKRGVNGVIVLAKYITGGDVRNLAHQLLQNWKVDMCQKGFLILVATENHKFWAARDYNLPLQGYELSQIFNSQKPYFKNGQYYQGIYNVLEQIQNHVGRPGWQGQNWVSSSKSWQGQNLQSSIRPQVPFSEFTDNDIRQSALFSGGSKVASKNFVGVLMIVFVTTFLIKFM